MRTKQRPVNEFSLYLKAVRVPTIAMRANISRNPNLACGTITSSPSSYFCCKKQCSVKLSCCPYFYLAVMFNTSIQKCERFTWSSSSSRGNGWPLSIMALMRKGSPRPRLMSNTLEPMALDTAISPNPSRATRIELMAS